MPIGLRDDLAAGLREGVIRPLVDYDMRHFLVDVPLEFCDGDWEILKLLYAAVDGFASRFGIERSFLLELVEMIRSLDVRERAEVRRVVALEGRRRPEAVPAILARLTSFLVGDAENATGDRVTAELGLLWDLAGDGPEGRKILFQFGIPLLRCPGLSHFRDHLFGLFDVGSTNDPDLAGAIVRYVARHWTHRSGKQESLWVIAMNCYGRIRRPRPIHISCILSVLARALRGSYSDKYAVKWTGTSLFLSAISQADSSAIRPLFNVVVDFCASDLEKAIGQPILHTLIARRKTIVRELAQSRLSDEGVRRWARIAAMVGGKFDSIPDSRPVGRARFLCEALAKP